MTIDPQVKVDMDKNNNITIESGAKLLIKAGGTLRFTDLGLGGAVCGNGIVDGSEACDDGNTVGGDGCSATCAFEICGNSVLDVGELCDDGNTIDDGNGCSSTCQLNNVCGNFIVESIIEACDAGGFDTPTCDADCTTVECGDGTVNFPAGELCDDGNAVDDGNGCSSACIFNNVCGNSVIESLVEACDDGNTVNGDGCSSTCQVESVDDFGDNALTAEPFPSITSNGVTKSGTINFAGDEDWFSFTIVSTKFIRMQTALTSPGMDTVLTLIAPDGTTEINENDDFPGLVLASRIEANLVADTYFVKVRHFVLTSSGESYTLTISDITP